jgi:hypothetical protein
LADFVKNIQRQGHLLFDLLLRRSLWHPFYPINCIESSNSQEQLSRHPNLVNVTLRGE